MMTNDERAIAMLRQMQATAELLGECDARFAEAMGEVVRLVERAADDEGLNLDYFWEKADESAERGRLHVEELRARLIDRKRHATDPTPPTGSSHVAD